MPCLPAGSSALLPTAAAWSDTPDSVCMAAVERLERQAAERLGSGSGPAAAPTSGAGGLAAGAGAGAAAGAAACAVDSPETTARQLSFTPSGRPVVVVGAPITHAATHTTPPLSSGGSGGGRAGLQPPTSHLGRSALQQAVACELQLQQDAVAASAGQGHKRTLAATTALEQVMAQHATPAGGGVGASGGWQQAWLHPQVAAAGAVGATPAPPTDEPGSKRLRGGEPPLVAGLLQQPADMDVDLPQKQLQLRLQEQGEGPAAAPAQLPPPDQATAAGKLEAPRPFDYCELRLMSAGSSQQLTC